MILSQAKNIFMPANVNSIVILLLTIYKQDLFVRNSVPFGTSACLATVALLSQLNCDAHLYAFSDHVMCFKCVTKVIYVY